MEEKINHFPCFGNNTESSRDYLRNRRDHHHSKKHSGKSTFFSSISRPLFELLGLVPAMNCTPIAMQLFFKFMNYWRLLYMKKDNCCLKNCAFPPVCKKDNLTMRTSILEKVKDFTLLDSWE